MSTIDSVIAQVIETEGGYVNNKADKGGETHFGITVAVARANGYKGEMINMPRAVAESIYRKRYITEPKFDQVLMINELIGKELIDTGVSMGPARAAEYLQRWLNGFNVTGSGYQDLFVDGRLGVHSFDALRRFLGFRGTEGARVLLRGLNSSQADRYLELTESNNTQREFLYGWISTRVEL